MIYFMASGASEKMAYSHAAFLFTEMQWIDAAAYNTGEYFHGPFEVSTEGKPYVFFMSDGATRPMDARALTFLERMGAKVARSTPRTTAWLTPCPRASSPTSTRCCTSPLCASMATRSPRPVSTR